MQIYSNTLCDHLLKKQITLTYRRDKSTFKYHFQKKFRQKKYSSPPFLYFSPPFLHLLKLNLRYPEFIWIKVFAQIAFIDKKRDPFGVSCIFLNPKLNSPGGIRTCDQSINSRSLYRWATEEYIKI